MLKEKLTKIQSVLDTKNRKAVACASAACVLMTGTLGIYALTRESEPDFALKDNETVKVEYGDRYSPDAFDFLQTEDMDKEDQKILKNEIKAYDNFQYEDDKDYLKTGKYKINITFRGHKLTKYVEVQDTTAPELKTEYSSIDITKGTDLAQYDFASHQMFSASDLSPVEISYDFSSADANTVGNYRLKAVAKDSFDNTSEKEIDLNITEAPGDDQILVTEVTTNQDGTKSIRNTLQNRKTETDTKSEGSGNSSSKKNSSGSSGSSANHNTGSSGQSFVANMSIAKKTTQAVTVVGNGGSYATLTVHTKRNGVWTETISCSARVGRNGITSSKHEGDGKTPAGIYSFGQAFGTAGNPGTSKSWLQVNNSHYWVDDVNSPYYNKLVDASQTGIQWSSAEHLIGYPTAYRYAVAVNYNTACTPGAGSAIFLHCSTGGSTAGCISVSQSNMIRILQSLQGDTLIGIYHNSGSLY